MTPEQIERLALEVGLMLQSAESMPPVFFTYYFSPEQMTAFAALVRIAALEEAAAMAESNSIISGSIGPLFTAGWGEANKADAAAIRALKGKA